MQFASGDLKSAITTLKKALTIAARDERLLAGAADPGQHAMEDGHVDVVAAAVTGAIADVRWMEVA